MRLKRPCFPASGGDSGLHLSGHTNGPSGAHYVGPDAWLAQQLAKDGSWWPEWSEWLEARSNGWIAPPGMGAAAKGYAPIIAAPGSYVHQA